MAREALVVALVAVLGTSAVSAAVLDGSWRVLVYEKGVRRVAAPEEDRVLIDDAVLFLDGDLTSAPIPFAVEAHEGNSLELRVEPALRLRLERP